MLVVKVEVWPGGEERKAFEIGRMEIGNVSLSGHVCDYTARIIQAEEKFLMVPALDKNFSVKAHDRRAGPWQLVKRVLEQAFPSAPVPAPVKDRKRSKAGAVPAGAPITTSRKPRPVPLPNEENQLFIDPPEGSVYGFPKPLPANFGLHDQEQLNRWLVENGYPQAIIDRYQGQLSCRIIGRRKD